jgi:hypothetical protein
MPAVSRAEHCFRVADPRARRDVVPRIIPDRKGLTHTLSTETVPRFAVRGALTTQNCESSRSESGYWKNEALHPNS